eukprot:TRINITY_DN4919_c5_g1_i1.p1 TRINITY_DN4919_c5_g1~~TRINITY_DN4919_c5_g1_i1.p1  ORF type:complete len:925 (+),score=188.63 TRINITY_DN4919_c5_g1_i1:92-2866(+)
MDLPFTSEPTSPVLTVPASRNGHADPAGLPELSSSGKDVPPPSRASSPDAQHWCSVSDLSFDGGEWGVLRAERQETALSAERVIEVLEFYVRRLSNYSATPPFAVFLLLFTASCFLSYHQQNSFVRLMQDAVATETMQQQLFAEVDSGQGIYDWVTTVAQNTHTQGAVPDVRANYLVEGLVLRQHRANRCSCRVTQASPVVGLLPFVAGDQACVEQYTADRLNGSQYSSGNAVTTRYAPLTTNPFVRDQLKSGMPRMWSVQGELRHYADENEQFTVLLPVSLGPSNVTEVVSALQSLDWIDSATQMVVVFAIFFNPARGEYVRVCHVVEFTHSGRTLTKTTADPFWFLLLDESALEGFLFALDILFALYLLVMLRDIVRFMVVNRRLGDPVVGPSELFMIVQFTLLLTSLCFRFMLWERSGDVAKDGNRVPGELLSDLSRHGRFFKLSHSLSVATLFCAWTRVLEQLRYNRQLNAVTETVRLGANDILSLGIVFSIIVLTYAFVGQQLYGWHIPSLESTGEAVRWLTLIVFTADVNQDDVLSRMFDLQPVWTPFYISTYIILSWLVLLNVVLGILAAAFSAASATTEDNRWSLRGIRDELSEMVCISDSTEEEQEQGKRAEDMEGAAAAAGKLSVPGWFRLLFITSRGADRALVWVRCHDVLRELQRRHDQKHPGEEDAGSSLTVTLATLKGEEVRRSGWMLNGPRTEALFNHAAARAVESFAEAEHAKQDEAEALFSGMHRVHSDIVRVAKRSHAERRSLARQIELLSEQLSVTKDELGRRASQNERRLTIAEGSILSEVEEAKRTLARDVDATREAVLAELAAEGHRLLGGVVEVRELQDVHTADLEGLAGMLREAATKEDLDHERRARMQVVAASLSRASRPSFQGLTESFRNRMRRPFASPQPALSRSSSVPGQLPRWRM